MAERGEVRAVAWMPQGSDLVADVAVGALQLTVGNPVDFDEDGGTLDLNGEQLDYTTIDLDTGTITLASAPTAAATAGDVVKVVSGGQVAIDYVAFVSLGDGDEVELVIPFAERDLWPEGEYDTPVVVELSDDLMDLVAVPGRSPLRDGSFIDPATLPAPATSDGLAPAVSPTPTVIGGIGALFIKWPAIINHDAVTYEVHLAPTTGFIPSAVTKAGELAGTSMTVRALPDGTPFTYGPAYYTRIIAKDVDGAAAPGPEANGSMVQITGPDVAASYVYAGTLIADQIIGGSISADLTISASLKTANTGQRVEMTNEGISLYGPTGSALVQLPTDPTLPAYFKGNAELNTTIINGNLSLRGVTNEISPASALTLAGKVNNPTTPPTPQITYAAPLGSWLTINSDYQLRGLTWVSDTAVGCWFTTNFYVGCQLMGFDPVAGGWGGLGGTSYNWPCPERAGTHWFNPVGGVVYVAGFFYVFGITYADADNAASYELRKFQKKADNSGVTLVASLNKGPLSTYQKQPVMGLTASGQPMYCYYSTSNKLRSATINTTTLADTTNASVPITTPPDNPTGAGIKDISYCQFGNAFDLSGANRLYVGHRADSTIYGFSGGDVTREVGMDFPTANGALMVGLCYGGPDAFFHSLDASGRLYAYTAIMWDAAQSSKWYAAYTLNDTNAGGTGTHTTGLSAKATFTMTKRAQLQLTTPAIQGVTTDDPDSVRLYVGRGASPPVDSGMILNASPAVGVTSVLLSSVTFTGTGGPANNFPSSGTAKIVDASGNTLIDSNGYSMFAPTGAMQMYAAAVAPTGWVLCDGRAISRTVFADLYNIIGTTFGAGDGSTTFNVPDMRTRLPIGAGALGSVGGTEGGAVEGSDRYGRMDHRHTHGGAGLATDTAGSGHGHTIDVVAETLTVTRQTNTTTGGTAQRVSELAGAVTGSHQHAGTSTTSVGGHSHTNITGSTASASLAPGAIANHPFTLLNFIIKA